MNHLVFLDARAGELEKILSGVKTMLIKESSPADSSKALVQPSDNLYFVRNHDDYSVRVKATVVRVLFVTNHEGEGLSHALKEMQPRLQLTEDQFNFWLGKEQILLVEFEAAQKIGVINIAPHKAKYLRTNQPGWISFEVFSQIAELDHP